MKIKKTRKSGAVVAKGRIELPSALGGYEPIIVLLLLAPF